MSSKKFKSGLVSVKCSVAGCNVHDQLPPGSSYTCNATWHARRTAKVTAPQHPASGNITVRPQQRQ